MVLVFVGVSFFLSLVFMKEFGNEFVGGKNKKPNSDEVKTVLMTVKVG